MVYLHASELAVYRGVFSWSDPTLRENIKHSVPDYDVKDPRTWPIVNLPDPRTSAQYVTSVPSSVIYGRIHGYGHNLSDLFLPSTRMAQHATDKTRTMNWRFRHYPFNFMRDGEVRRGFGIPKDDFDYWMHFVNGENWEATAATSMSRPSNVDSATRTPYEKIMAALAKKKRRTSRGTESRHLRMSSKGRSKLPPRHS
jgi:hypothetical protein